MGIEFLMPRQVLYTCFRYRYFSERKPKIYRYGYEDKLEFRGLLPRSKDFKCIIPMQIYKPKDVWSSKRALYGQNDYIDILGDGKIHPTQITYNVPYWLRGFGGNEYQMLVRKRKMIGRLMMIQRPSKWRQMNLRLQRLHKFLNVKTKDWFWKKPFST